MLKIVTKIEDVVVWPSIRAEHTKCLVFDEKTPDTQFEATLHKAEVELIETLTHLQKSLKLFPNTMDDLWTKIENFGQMKYEKGSQEQSESDAGADL